MPPTDNKKIIDQKHPEWSGNVLRYCWLQDSRDGDHVYREGQYGVDRYGYPVRNLIRHPRERPIDARGQTLPYNASGFGLDAAARAGDDAYELRRARTPIYNFVGSAIETHLAKIYGTEIRRDGPEPLKAFWDDVDGNGTSVDEWMRTETADLLRTFGVLDICIDHPPVPKGESVKSKADELRLKLKSAVASYILPQNMQWWKLDAKGNYLECLVREPQDDGLVYFRHWTANESTLYDDKGNAVSTLAHKFGQVPIVRLFDRKDSRGKNTGKSWSEPLAILMREYHNRDSELIISDTLHAHAVLMMPEDLLNGDDTVVFGPSYVIPMKKNNSGGTAMYQASAFLEPPKSGAESIRQNKQDIRTEADRYACMQAPAGTTGNTGATVAQSGISKQLDATTANDLLTKLAVVLGRAEWKIAKLAMTVLNDGNITEQELDAIKVNYPGSFDLFSADQISKAIQDLQLILSASGQCPTTEITAVQRYIGEWLQGLEDDEYKLIDDEIKEFITSKSEIKRQQTEAGIDPKTGQPHIPMTPDPTTASPANPTATKPKSKPKSPKPKPPKAA